MPRLPNHLIKKLQKAYRKDFGRNLSYEDAAALGEALVKFFYDAGEQPLSKDDIKETGPERRVK